MFMYKDKMGLKGISIIWQISNTKVLKSIFYALQRLHIYYMYIYAYIYVRLSSFYITTHDLMPLHAANIKDCSQLINKTQFTSDDQRVVNF